LGREFTVLSVAGEVVLKVSKNWVHVFMAFNSQSFRIAFVFFEKLLCRRVCGGNLCFLARTLFKAKNHAKNSCRQEFKKVGCRFEV
jgi:hypothetical protein